MATRKTGRIRFLLTLLVLAGLAAGTIPLFLTPPAGLELRLRDGQFGTDLSDTTVRVFDPQRDLEVMLTATREIDGFSAAIDRIRSGHVVLQLMVKRFEPTSVNLSLPPLELTRVDVPLIPNFGRLEISAVNARSVEDVLTADATVQVGNVQSPTQADVVFVNVEPGRHVVQVSADGFCSGEREVEVRRAETSKVLVPLSPEVSASEQARMVLDWNENPRDLDAHVILSSGTKRVKSSHIFFKNLRGTDLQGASYAELDVDWKRSEGFETITVYDQIDGVFQYFIHHYAGTGTLGGSAATVELITDGCRSRRFAVPMNCNKLFWYVADMKVEGSETVIIERNQCQDEMPIQWKRKKAED